MVTKLFPGIKSTDPEYRKLLRQRWNLLNPFYSRKDSEKRRRKKGIAPQKYLEEYTQEDWDRIHKSNRLAVRKYKESHPERDILRRAKDRAKKKGLDFSLVENDIVIPDLCPVYNTKIALNFDRVRDDSPSIDRIDNSKGYTKDNIIIVSYKANRLKNDATIDDLQKIVEFYCGIA